LFLRGNAYDVLEILLHSELITYLIPANIEGNFLYDIPLNLKNYLRQECLKVDASPSEFKIHYIFGLLLLLAVIDRYQDPQFYDCDLMEHPEKVSNRFFGNYANSTQIKEDKEYLRQITTITQNVLKSHLNCYFEFNKQLEISLNQQNYNINPVVTFEYDRRLDAPPKRLELSANEQLETALRTMLNIG